MGEGTPTTTVLERPHTRSSRKLLLACVNPNVPDRIRFFLLRAIFFGRPSHHRRRRRVDALDEAAGDRRPVVLARLRRRGHSERRVLKGRLPVVGRPRLRLPVVVHPPRLVQLLEVLLGNEEGGGLCHHVRVVDEGEEPVRADAHGVLPRDDLLADDAGLPDVPVAVFAQHLVVERDALAVEEVDVLEEFLFSLFLLCSLIILL